MPNRIRELRESKGFSRPWLADQCNVTERTVIRWEAGETGVPDRHKARLAEIFGVSIEHVMGWDAEATAA